MQDKITLREVTRIREGSIKKTYVKGLANKMIKLIKPPIRLMKNWIDRSFSALDEHDIFKRS